MMKLSAPSFSHTIVAHKSAGETTEVFPI